jgi:hypothetical protein
MDTDRLFLATIDDLNTRVQPGLPEYDVLMAAPLLRKLLLDDRPLVHQANTSRRMKIRYRINTRRPLWQLAGSPRPTFWSIQDGLDPESALPFVLPSEVDHDTLLRHVVMLVGDHDVTIRDLILQISNVSGGVHAGSPKTDKAAILQQMSEEFRIEGYQPDVRALQAITRVVLRGLRPLYEQVKQELSS